MKNMSLVCYTCSICEHIFLFFYIVLYPFEILREISRHIHATVFVLMCAYKHNYMNVAGVHFTVASWEYKTKHRLVCVQYRTFFSGSSSSAYVSPKYSSGFCGGGNQMWVSEQISWSRNQRSVTQAHTWSTVFGLQPWAKSLGLGEARCTSQPEPSCLDPDSNNSKSCCKRFSWVQQEGIDGVKWNRLWER